MELNPNVSSDRSWVYSVPADFADGEAKPELLAVRFANPENAEKFKAKFIECQKIVAEQEGKTFEPKESKEESDEESEEETDL
jgi:Ran-binding protein 1